VIVAALLAVQIGGHIVADCRDNTCVLEDKHGRPIGLVDKTDGHVIGKWDRQLRFVVDKPKCAFTYSEKLETQALMFLAADSSSDVPLHFDMKRPAIALYRSKIELDFSPSERGIVDGSFYRLVVEACSNHVLSHTFVGPF
jgi:hypothetical protein